MCRSDAAVHAARQPPAAPQQRRMPRPRSRGQRMRCWSPWWRPYSVSRPSLPLLPRTCAGPGFAWVWSEPECISAAWQEIAWVRAVCAPCLGRPGSGKSRPCRAAGSRDYCEARREHGIGFSGQMEQHCRRAQRCGLCAKLPGPRASPGSGRLWGCCSCRPVSPAQCSMQCCHTVMSRCRLLQAEIDALKGVDWEAELARVQDPSVKYPGQ